MRKIFLLAIAAATLGISVPSQAQPYYGPGMMGGYGGGYGPGYHDGTRLRRRLHDGPRLWRGYGYGMVPA